MFHTGTAERHSISLFRYFRDNGFCFLEQRKNFVQTVVGSGVLIALGVFPAFQDHKEPVSSSNMATINGEFMGVEFLCNKHFSQHLRKRVALTSAHTLIFMEKKERLNGFRFPRCNEKIHSAGERDAVHRCSDGTLCEGLKRIGIKADKTDERRDKLKFEFVLVPRVNRA